MLDLAGVPVLKSNGTVFAVEPEQVPISGPLAALFRYELGGQQSCCDRRSAAAVLGTCAGAHFAWLARWRCPMEQHMQE